MSASASPCVVPAAHVTRRLVEHGNDYTETEKLPMVPGKKYSNSFRSPGEIHTYALEVSSPGLVLHVVAAPCRGEIEFFVTSSVEAIRDRRFELKRTELNKGRLEGDFRAEARTYYISIRGVSSESSRAEGDGIVYTVQVELLSDSEGLDPYAIENYGVIETTQVASPSRIVLRWGRVYRKDLRRSFVENVEYSIYVAREGEANMFTPCGIAAGNTLTVASQLTANTYTYPLRSDQSPGVKLVFGMLARVPGEKQAVAYIPATVQVFRPGSGGWQFGCIRASYNLGDSVRLYAGDRTGRGHSVLQHDVPASRRETTVRDV